MKIRVALVAEVEKSRAWLVEKLISTKKLFLIHRYEKVLFIYMNYSFTKKACLVFVLNDNEYEWNNNKKWHTSDSSLFLTTSRYNGPVCV